MPSMLAHNQTAPTDHREPKTVTPPPPYGRLTTLITLLQQKARLHGRSLVSALILSSSTLTTSTLTTTAQAESINVAVASNFTTPMRELVHSFEQKTGHRIKLSFGSSGKIYAQISHGAPFQAFFSADQAKPVALENEGLAIKGSRMTYAEGSLALWSAQSGLAGDNEKILKKRLTHGEFRKLALANPRLAPYGQAAIEVLQKLNLVETTRSKWVQGENISQTYQFVDSGNAELGFVSLSQILKQGQISKGTAWVIPHELYNPIRQDAVILASGKNSPATHEFMAFMHSHQAGKIIEAYGYKSPIAQNEN